jgi:hypothetical protein
VLALKHYEVLEVSPVATIVHLVLFQEQGKHLNLALILLIDHLAAVHGVRGACEVLGIEVSDICHYEL